MGLRPTSWRDIGPRILVSKFPLFVTSPVTAIPPIHPFRRQPVEPARPLFQLRDSGGLRIPQISPPKTSLKVFFVILLLAHNFGFGRSRVPTTEEEVMTSGQWLIGACGPNMSSM